MYRIVFTRPGSVFPEYRDVADHQVAYQLFEILQSIFNGVSIHPLGGDAA